MAASLPPDLSSNAFDALRAARADDRLYDPLCLNRLERVIDTHGDILVSNAKWAIFSTFRFTFLGPYDSLFDSE